MGMGVVAAHESPWPVTLVRALVRNTEVLAGQDAVGSRDVVDLESSSMDGKADVRHVWAITRLCYVVSVMINPSERPHFMFKARNKMPHPVRS